MIIIKKIILTTSIVVAGIVFYVLQEPLNEIRVGRGIDKIFSDDLQVFDYAEENFTVHAMGMGSSEQKIITVVIKKSQYKKQAEEFFRDLLDSNGLKSYEIDVQVDDLTAFKKEKKAAENNPLYKYNPNVKVEKIDLKNTNEIETFSRAISDSTKEEGVSMSAYPKYSFSLGNDSYLLWITEDLGRIMNTKDIYTIYKLSDRSLKEIKEVVLEL